MIAWDAALLTGGLTAAAIYLILHRGFVRMLFGFTLLTHAGNLFFITVAGDPTGARAPLVHPGRPEPMVDPLPQALVLTAIVIGFGITSYLVLLLYRLFLDLETTDVARLDPTRKEEE